jgi:5-formyltetrahydrofolate cyclo-ligase
MEKDDIRTLVTQRLQNKAAESKAAESEQVCNKVWHLLKGGRIAAYDPLLEDEVDVRPLLQRILDTYGEVLLPRMWKGFMHVRQVVDLEKDLKKSKSSGIWVPKKRCPIIDPAEITSIIVPGRAFDKWCGRVGRGRGHYDRFLTGATKAVCRCLLHGSTL